MKFRETKYLIAAPQDDIPGQGYIVGTDRPWPVARLLKFRTDEEMQAWLKQPKAYQFVQVEGYRIFVLEAGTMEDADHTEDMRIILHQMATWYAAKSRKDKRFEIQN